MTLAVFAHPPLDHADEPVRTEASEYVLYPVTFASAPLEVEERSIFALAPGADTEQNGSGIVSAEAAEGALGPENAALRDGQLTSVGPLDNPDPGLATRGEGAGYVHWVVGPWAESAGDPHDLPTSRETIGRDEHLSRGNAEGAEIQSAKGTDGTDVSGAGPAGKGAACFPGGGRPSGKLYRGVTKKTSTFKPAPTGQSGPKPAFRRGSNGAQSTLVECLPN